MRVLGIVGSLRRGSYNRRLLLEAAELLARGTDFDLFEDLKSIPPYDEDDDVEDADPAVTRLRRSIAETDAILIATPEYNASVPGQLKNAIDWASRPRGASALLGKPVAVIGASTGAFGAVWAQADARKALATAGARVVDGDLPVPYAHRRLEETGCLLDDGLREQLGNLLDALVGEVRSPIAAAA
jgi:chromate reductase